MTPVRRLGTRPATVRSHGRFAPSQSRRLPRRGSSLPVGNTG